jgi:hypothetical protein
MWDDYRGNCSAIDEDTDAETEAFCAEGGWHWCQVRVQVIFRDDANPRNWAVQRDQVLGEDYLGGCSYHDLADFKSGGYFRDMVATAIDEARSKLSRMSADIRIAA